MSRSASSAVENNFVNGWITEATGLNFPENAVTSTDNIIYYSNGSVDRRLGIDLEASFSTSTLTVHNDAVMTEFLWESVSGDGSKTFFIQQYGEKLYFYNVGSNEALSDNLSFILDMTAYSQVAIATFRSKPFQFAPGFGRLFIAHPHMEPLYLTYSISAGTASLSTITIQTRDTVGIPGAPVDRLSSLSTDHHYDLLNQGWNNGFINKFVSYAGVYPSDYDVWWLYKTPDSFGIEVFLTDIAFSAGILNQVDRGNSPAPKGSIILSEFYQDRGIYVSGVPVVSSGSNRPSTIAFHAGRVFYAGVQAQDYNSKIYFSQILESVDQAAYCYQQNDPTSQYSSDLLPTDGGVISIPEVGTVIKLWPMEGALIVFASNGIWQITGSQGIGFAANDYTVKKISKQEILSASSFVNVLGFPIWWSTDGIYGLTTDSVGSIQIKSFSAGKIDRNYYEDLSASVKSYAKGSFNLKDKIVQWLYRETIGSTVNENQTYTKIMNYDVQTSAFYTFTIPSTYAHVKGILSVQGYGSTPVNEQVIDNAGNNVTDNALSNVIVIGSTSAPVTALFKYTTVYGASFNLLTFAEMRNVNHIDWLSVPLTNGGTDALAYFASGYRLRGDAQRKFQSNYITFYTRNETSSAFYVQGRWDYANSGDTGRWSSRQRIDISETAYSYAKRRVKIRGHGVALQYYIQSIPLRPLNLIGWSAWDTTNGSI